MAYKKNLVDNSVCSRRFHLTYDDEAEKRTHVEVACPHCGQRIFQAENHPAVTLARDENLVKTTTLARDIVRECRFKDPLAPH